MLVSEGPPFVVIIVLRNAPVFEWLVQASLPSLETGGAGHCQVSRQERLGRVGSPLLTQSLHLSHLIFWEVLTLLH